MLGIAIVIATVAGPLAAVTVTRVIDERRDQRARQRALFRSLMGTRRTPLSDERVKALNLVEIEFYGIGPVEHAHRELMAHINTHSTDPAAWNDRQRNLLTRLLTAMATHLGYNLEQLAVLEGGYYPQGYANIEQEQQLTRQLFVEVLSGRRPLSIAPVAPTPPPPFPPPPPPEQAASPAAAPQAPAP